MEMETSSKLKFSKTRDEWRYVVTKFYNLILYDCIVPICISLMEIYTNIL